MRKKYTEGEVEHKNPRIIVEKYGYKYKYEIFNTKKYKWLTNWLFTPETIYRRRCDDGTYEEMIKGKLKIFYGTGAKDFTTLSFSLWDDMFASIMSLSKMHASCNQFARGRQVDLLKNYIWTEALRAKCPVKKLEKPKMRRKKELRRMKQAKHEYKKAQMAKKEKPDGEIEWGVIKGLD